MSIGKPRFIVGDRGNHAENIFDIAEYERLMEDIEELDAIRAYDAAIASGDEAIPFEQAVNEIRRSRVSAPILFDGHLATATDGD